MPVVTDYTALISGYSWNGMTDPGAPVFVSYTFLDNAEVPSLADYEPYDNDGYFEFTATQRQSFREALDQFELVAGVEFIEVDNPDLASIDIMNTSGSQWGGWANYGIATDWYTTDGYIVIDGSGTYESGTGWFEVLLHEVGHAMGLKHPFSGDVTLDPSLDNEDHTLMSYTGNGVYDTSLAPLDVDALQHLYGDQATISAAWSWDWSDVTEQFTLSGAATEDILIGIDVASTISGFGGNDTLWGRDADDILIGGTGNDTLNGGAGSDTAVFTGNWSDYTINETAFGVFSISDNRGAGYDGLDTITNIEFYSFADGTAAKNDLLSGGLELPDYIAENVSITGSTFSLGEEISVNYDIINQGAENLFTLSTVSIYLSQNAVFDPNTAVLVATDQIPGLLANETYSSSTFFSAPTGISGSYNVFVVADDLNDIAESNENNNVSLTPVAITFTASDLTTSNVGVATTTLLAGEATTVTFDLNNIGNEDADLVLVNTGIYLSTDATITATDTNLVNYDHTGTGVLAAVGTLIGVSQDITLPGGLAPGTYYIGTIADDSNILAEGNESNNASPAPIQITLEAAPTEPEYIVENVSIEVATENVGDSFILNYDVTNIGADTSDWSRVGFYFSTDNQWDASDTLISYNNITGRTSGESYHGGGWVKIPGGVAAGDYYIFVVADTQNVLSESNENNNVSTDVVQINITAADLTISNLALGSTSLVAGQSTSATFDLNNIGNHSAGGLGNEGYSYQGVYLSTDSTITTDDILLSEASQYVNGLPAAASLIDLALSFTIPGGTAAGTYYIGVIADRDDRIDEGNEDNNASPAPVQVTISGPTDLSPDGVTVSSGTYNTGSSLDVTFDVDNLSGEASNAYTVKIYLSTNSSVTTADIEIGSFVLSNLDGGTSLEDYIAKITLPNDGSIANGTYYVGVIVDPDNSVVETDENNNIAVAANTITVHNPAADLVASDFKQQNGSAEVPTGGEVTFTFNISNAGDLDVGSFDARIYLSTDSTITTSDILLTTITGLSITAGATINDQSVTFTVPANYNLGDYHFGVILDHNNQISESDETNNAAGTPIAITAAAPGNDPGLASQWYIDNPSGYDLNVQDVWPDYTGDGVKLAIIDTGIDYNHTDLAPNYDTSLDYDFGDNDSDAIFEGSEAHGTQVAGVAGGASNGLGIIGVAPDLTLFSYRYDAATYAQAVAQWTSALNQATTDADIVNMSLGFQNVQWDFSAGYYLSGAFEDNFLDAAYSTFGAAFENTATNGRGGLGTIITVSAGNERDADGNVNYDNMLNSPYTIAVGAVTSTGAQSSFSNGGAALLVSAPGSDIYTSDPTGSAGSSNGDYTTTDGTSFSSPAVAGVIALMLEANGNLGARDVQEILAYSAVGSNYASNGAGNWNGGGIYTSLSQGFGRVDAEAAVRLAETWTDQHTFGNVTELVYTSGAVNLAIPDNAGSVTDTITISYPNHFELDHVEVFVDLSHTAIDDLTIKIISPDGLNSYLLDTPPTGLYQDFPTNGFTFMTTQFWGEDISGDWIISIQDSATGDTGTLEDWSLFFYGDVDDGNDTYFYNDEYSNFDQNGSRAILTDSDGGIDAINAAQVTTASTIDLRAGNTSTIDGESLTIATGTTIETAYGGDGNDTLYGNTSDNILYGGRGDDLLNYIDGFDNYNGDAGSDTADFSGLDASLWVGIGRAGVDAWNSQTWNAIAEFDSIEHVIGSAYNDKIIGSSANNTLSGGAGDDLLVYNGGFDQYNGGADSDTADFSGLDASIWVGIGRSGTDAWNSQTWNAIAEFDSIENVIGSAYNDKIIGSSANNALSGGGGDDLLVYNGGLDHYNGDADTDTADFSDFDASLWVGIGRIGLDAWNSQTWNAIAEFDSIENVIGTIYADKFIGSAADNTLFGGAGDDLFVYNGGLDHYNGDADTDTADFSDFDASVWVGIGRSGLDAWNSQTWDAIAEFDSIENVVGSAYNDKIIGSSANNALFGGDGDDLLVYNGGFDNYNGDAGSDTADFSGLDASIWIGIGRSGKDAWNSQTWDAIAEFDSIENVIGTIYADKFIGSSADNTLSGGTGDDLFVYNGGFDHYNGDADTDTADFSDLDASLWVGIGRTGLDAWNSQTWDAIAEFDSIENVIGTIYADKFIGSAADELVHRQCCRQHAHWRRW